MRIIQLCSSLPLLVALLMVPACRTTSAPPAETAGEVAAQLISGDVDADEEAFEAIDDDDDDREVAYNVLYEQAGGLHAQRDYDSSARILRFLVDQYPDARAPKEALLYTLLLQRGRAR